MALGSHGRTHIKPWHQSFGTLSLGNHPIRQVKDSVLWLKALLIKNSTKHFRWFLVGENFSFSKQQLASS